MKKMKKKTSKKQHQTKIAVDADRHRDLSNKVHSVNNHTRMCGRQEHVIRINDVSSGLPKWRRR